MFFLHTMKTGSGKWFTKQQKKLTSTMPWNEGSWKS